jgi:hypothetical protein
MSVIKSRMKTFMKKKNVCLDDGQFRILRHDGVEVIGSISAGEFIEEVTIGLHAERT